MPPYQGVFIPVVQIEHVGHVIIFRGDQITEIAENKQHRHNTNSPNDIYHQFRYKTIQSL